MPLYWIVDLDAQKVEVYPLRDDPLQPTVVEDELRWTPLPGAPTLAIPVPELFRGFE